MPTFNDLCYFAWAQSKKNAPTTRDLTDEQVCQMAGAWMQERKIVDRIDAVSNSSFTDDLMTSICAWLQAPTDVRQAEVLKLLRYSVCEAAIDDIDRQLNDIAQEAKLCG